MDTFFKRIRLGILNDHFDLLGGGTVHSFKLIEYLKKYYDCEVYVPNNPKSNEWLKDFLNLDTSGIKVMKYSKGIGLKYHYLFLNISHWRIEETPAFKKYALVFFPQFFFPLYDYSFLANSEYTKNNIITRWKQPEDKIKVLYPPIMTSEFKPPASWKDKKNYILHVSRINAPAPEADKGHAQMILAFKEMVDAGLKDWEFHMVGQVQNRTYFEMLQNMTTGYPIKIHEGISFSELQKLYTDSKIYWHMTGIGMPGEPGAQEHFGMTIVEAMSSGTVPISYNSAGPKEIIIDGDSGFLVDNEQQLKQKTMQIIKDKSLWEYLAIAAIKRSKRFDEKEIEKEFFTIVAGTSKVSIIITAFNNFKYTKECVERLFQVTPPGFELILVDNNSSDETGKWVEEVAITHENVKFIHTGKNLSFAESNNLALEQATREYVCYLNNDTVPQWGWLERLVDVLETKPDAGVVGARLYFPQDSQGVWKVQHAGTFFDYRNNPDHTGRFQTDDSVRKAGIEEVEAVTGACMLIRKDLAKFSELYERGYYEDDDLCLRIREKGYKIYMNHEAKLIHHEGKTQDLLKKEDNAKFVKITAKNYKLFHEIWDGKITSLPKINPTLNMIGIDTVTKIEIGGGEHPIHPEYAQVDLRSFPHIKYNNDARMLPFPSNSLTNICSCYLLQCFGETDAEDALKEWFRCLQPGGQLELHVPDLKQVMRDFLSTGSEKSLKELYGNFEHELNRHQWGYDSAGLDRILSRVNFVRISLIKPPTLHPDALSVVTYKPNANP